jgi:hypothetical protein
MADVADFRLRRVRGLLAILGASHETCTMEPAVFGPTLWDAMFACAFHLPVESAAEVFVAFESLVPCPHCRRHYRSYCARYPFRPQSADPVQWAWTIRDMVNQSLGRPSLPFVTLEARRRTFTSCATPTDLVDCASLMALQVETVEGCRALACAWTHFAALVARTAPRDASAFAPFIDESYVSPATAWLHIMGCKNKLLGAMGLAPQTREEFLAQYEHGRAVAKKVAPPARSRTRARRR